MLGRRKWLEDEEELVPMPSDEGEEEEVEVQNPPVPNYDEVSSAKRRKTTSEPASATPFENRAVRPQDDNDLLVADGIRGITEAEDIRTEGKRTFLSARFAEINEAEISKAQMAIPDMPENRPGRAGSLLKLGMRLYLRYTQTDDADDLDEAISSEEMAIRAMPKDDPNRAECLFCLGHMLFDRCTETDDAAGLDAAISKTETAVREMPKNHPLWAETLYNLGKMRFVRYEHKNAVDDLNEAILKTGEAVSAMPKDHPDVTAWMHGLARMQFTRYAQTRDDETLDTVISKIKMVVSKYTDPNGPEDTNKQNHPAFLQAGLSLLKYLSTGDTNEYNAAVSKLPLGAPEYTSERLRWLSLVDNVSKSLRAMEPKPTERSDEE
ncbi:hypothetical protein F5X98DRAFT_380479 [Xylaria grammica]|nr:hypothetical protein F5X98DRAFT_380479 [Xylaria grammica]